MSFHGTDHNWQVYKYATGFFNRASTQLLTITGRTMNSPAALWRIIHNEIKNLFFKILTLFRQA
jgi:hypothetical protein